MWLQHVAGEEVATQPTPDYTETSSNPINSGGALASDDGSKSQVDHNVISEEEIMHQMHSETEAISETDRLEVDLVRENVSKPQGDQKANCEGGITQKTPSIMEAPSETSPAHGEKSRIKDKENLSDSSFHSKIINNKKKERAGSKSEQDTANGGNINNIVSASLKANLEKKLEDLPKLNETKDITPLLLKNNSKVIVSILHQKMYLLFDNKHFREYPISTSKYGIGDEFGSYKTPTGIFRVHSKYGDGLNLGAVLKSRKPTREIVAPNSKDRDPIVTRIIWLEGLEPSNRHAFERCIYIHGTPQETNLGRPASFGCVRMASKDVVQVYEVLPHQSCVAILNEFDKKTLKKLRFIEDKCAS